MLFSVTEIMRITSYCLWPLINIQPDLLKSSRTLQSLGRDWGLLFIYDLSLGLRGSIEVSSMSRGHDTRTLGVKLWDGSGRFVLSFTNLIDVRRV